MNDFLKDPRFSGIKRFEQKVWLSSPTMHGEEQHWVDEAIQTNWVSTIGENISVIEREMASFIGCKYAVALSTGTASLHLATKLAGERLMEPHLCMGFLYLFIATEDGISQCNEGDWVARDQDGGCHVLKAEEMQ